MLHNGVLKVSDLKYAKIMLETKYSVIKKPRIILPPEILKDSKFGIKSNIWSIGLIFYEMIYGFSPYKANDFDKLEE